MRKLSRLQKKNKKLALETIKRKYPYISAQGANAILANIEVETSFKHVREKAGSWKKNRSRGPVEVAKYNKKHAIAIKNGTKLKKTADWRRINGRMNDWAKENNYGKVVDGVFVINEKKAAFEFDKLNNTDRQSVRYKYNGGLGGLQTTILDWDDEGKAAMDKYVLSMKNPSTGENFTSFEEFNKALDDPKTGYQLGLDYAIGFEGQKRNWNYEQLNNATPTTLRSNTKNGINPDEDYNNSSHVVEIFAGYDGVTNEDGNTTKGGSYIDFEQTNPPPTESPINDEFRQELLNQNLDNQNDATEVVGSGNNTIEVVGSENNNDIDEFFQENNGSYDETFESKPVESTGGSFGNNIVNGFLPNTSASINTPFIDDSTSQTQSNDGDGSINSADADLLNSLSVEDEDYEVIDEPEEDDPDAYPEDLGKKARDYIDGEYELTEEELDIEGVNTPITTTTTLDIDGEEVEVDKDDEESGDVDVEVEVENNGKDVIAKEEDETDTRENFENNPMELFGTFMLVENIAANQGETTSRDQTANFFQTQTNESLNLPNNKDQIQSNVDDAVEKVNQDISIKEEASGKKYVEGENKIEVLQPKYEGGRSISIDGLEFHSGQSTDRVKDGKRSDYVYSKDHPKYVAGKQNILSIEDVEAFNAKLWVCYVDKKKNKLNSSMLDSSSVDKIKKEGYTAYKTRMDEEFRNVNTGYIPIEGEFSKIIKT